MKWIFTILLILSPWYGFSQDILTDEQVLAFAKEDPRVQDILTDFPAVDLKPVFSDRFQVWIIEVFHPEAGQVGVISVSPETKQILEFDVNIDRLLNDDLDNEPQENDYAGGFWEALGRGIQPEMRGGTWFWVSLVLGLLIAGNFQRVLSWRNLDLLLLYALAPFLLLIWTHMQAAFTGLFIITCLLLIRVVREAFQPRNPIDFSAINAKGALIFLAGVMILLHIHTLYSRGIGDAGIWSAVGAEYLLKEGRLPYGTEFGPHCVYGPLMYAAFVPAAMIVPSGTEFNAESGTVIPNYENFVMYGVQTTVLLFDLLTLSALYFVGRRYGNIKTGLVLMLLYGFSPYMVGVVGEMGIERASHVMATPLILFAVLGWRKKEVSGGLLGVAAGMLFYPVFLFPLWAGFYGWREGWRSVGRFMAAFAMVGVLCLLMLQFMVVPIHDEPPIQAFLDDTVLQQQYKEGYGTSRMSIWGQYPSLGQGGKTAMGVLYCLFCVGLAYAVKPGSEQKLVLFTAAVLLGTQLVLSFGGGTYIGFYLAPLLVGLFTPLQDPLKSET